MRKIVLMILLTLVNSNAVAEWTQVGSKNQETDLTLYVDYETIQKKDDNARMWSLVDFETMQEEKTEPISAKTHHEYECKNEKIKQLFYSLYNESMGGGTMTYSNSDAHEWASVLHKSQDEVLLKIACGKQI